jgi:hypothetical protein
MRIAGIRLAMRDTVSLNLEYLRAQLLAQSAAHAHGSVNSHLCHFSFLLNGTLELKPEAPVFSGEAPASPAHGHSLFVIRGHNT